MKKIEEGGHHLQSSYMKLEKEVMGLELGVMKKKSKKLKEEKLKDVHTQLKLIEHKAPVLQKYRDGMDFISDTLRIFFLGFNAYKDMVVELYSDRPTNIRWLRPLWQLRQLKLELPHPNTRKSTIEAVRTYESRKIAPEGPYIFFSCFTIVR